MAAVVVCGGGVIGLSTGMMLADDGHDVTVLEADPRDPPATPVEAWDDWRRAGVAQFRQPHTLFPRFRAVVEQELPGLVDRLTDGGCAWSDYTSTLPPTVADHAPRPGDDRLRFVTGRRPVTEAVVATAAAEHPRLTVRRGVRATGLVAGPSAVPGVPHVAGVRTGDGDVLATDLVVDAMGRRTPSGDWLAELDARPPHTESQTGGFVYYTRYFTGAEQPRRTGPQLTPLGSISLITLIGDNGTWSVTVFGPTRDAPLKALRDPGVFTRVVAACPRQAHWLDGRPITEVLAMAGVLDCYRRLVVDGAPVVTGHAPVGDAWACTNPSAGRGLSVGMAHAQLLRATAREHLADPAGFTRAYDEATEREVTPFYRHQVAADRVRLAEMDAVREGREPPPPDPARARLLTAAVYDADAFRGLMDIITCLALPEQVLARPGMREILERYADQPPPVAPGPDRRELLDLLAG